MHHLKLQDLSQPENLIRCLVVDDEPPAREILTRYISGLPMLQLVGECGNAVEALQFLQSKGADLMFLDIRMPQLNGIEFLKAVKNPPAIIMTTAFAEYAVEGYELDVRDYLLKPIHFDRFVKAVNKVFQQSDKRVNEPVQPIEQEKTDSFVYFRADRKMVKVLLDDILYVEGMKDYVKVITKKGMLITKQSMASVEAMLPERQFIRVHRSFIISIPRIKSYTNELVEIESAEIPIGKLFRHEVLKTLAG